jgi:glycosidase
MRRAVYDDIMKWWLERGADGFRMDVINLVSPSLSSHMAVRQLLPDIEEARIPSSLDPGSGRGIPMAV